MEAQAYYDNEAFCKFPHGDARNALWKSTVVHAMNEISMTGYGYQGQSLYSVLNRAHEHGTTCASSTHTSTGLGLTGKTPVTFGHLVEMINVAQKEGIRVGRDTILVIKLTVAGVTTHHCLSSEGGEDESVVVKSGVGVYVLPFKFVHFQQALERGVVGVMGSDVVCPVSESSITLNDVVDPAQSRLYEDSWFGDKLHNLDVACALVARGAPKHVRTQLHSDYVSGVAQAEWLRTNGYGNSRVTTSQLSTMFESHYVSLRDEYLAGCFPDVPKTAYLGVPARLIDGQGRTTTSVESVIQKLSTLTIPQRSVVGDDEHVRRTKAQIEEERGAIRGELAKLEATSSRTEAQTLRLSECKNRLAQLRVEFRTAPGTFSQCVDGRCYQKLFERPVDCGLWPQVSRVRAIEGCNTQRMCRMVGNNKWHVLDLGENHEIGDKKFDNLQPDAQIGGNAFSAFAIGVGLATVWEMATFVRDLIVDSVVHDGLCYQKAFVRPPALGTWPLVCDVIRQRGCNVAARCIKTGIGLWHVCDDGEDPEGTVALWQVPAMDRVGGKPTDFDKLTMMAKLFDDQFGRAAALLGFSATLTKLCSVIGDSGVFTVVKTDATAAQPSFTSNGLSFQVIRAGPTSRSFVGVFDEGVLRSELKSNGTFPSDTVAFLMCFGVSEINGMPLTGGVDYVALIPSDGKLHFKGLAKLDDGVFILSYTNTFDMAGMPEALVAGNGRFRLNKCFMAKL